MDILVIALLTMICVGEGWEDMEEFGQYHECAALPRTAHGSD